MCAVPWGGVHYHGVFSTVGDILSTVEGVRYRGGYYDITVMYTPHGTAHTLYRAIRWKQFSNRQEIRDKQFLCKDMTVLHFVSD